MPAVFVPIEVGPEHHCAYRSDPGTQGLCQRHNIRLYSVMLAREHFAGPVHSGLDFVNRDENVMLPANFNQRFHRFRIRGNYSPFSLNEFHYHHIDFFGRKQFLKLPLHRADAVVFPIAPLGRKRKMMSLISQRIITNVYFFARHQRNHA